MEFTPVQKAIIRELYIGGHNVPAAIADNTEFHRKSVQRSLKELEDRGITRRKNEYGVWRLTEPGLVEARHMLFGNSS